MEANGHIIPALMHSLHAAQEKGAERAGQIGKRTTYEE